MDQVKGYDLWNIECGNMIMTYDPTPEGRAQAFKDFAEISERNPHLHFMVMAIYEDWDEVIMQTGDNSREGC